MNYQIYTSKGFFGSSASDDLLDSVLRNIAIAYSEDPGMEWADKYGTDTNNEVFRMKKYCWCEQDKCPYCWSFEEDENCVPTVLPSREIMDGYGMTGDNTTAPNFWYKPLDFKVWWYKYIGRSVVTNKQLTDGQLAEMLQRCCRSVANRTYK